MTELSAPGRTTPVVRFVKLSDKMGLMIEGDSGGVAECLRRSVPKLNGSTRGGLNPVVGTTNHKPTVSSAAHPSEIGK